MNLMPRSVTATLLVVVSGQMAAASGQDVVAHEARLDGHTKSCQRWARKGRIVAASEQLLVVRFGNTYYGACYAKTGALTKLGDPGDRSVGQHDLIAARGKYAGLVVGPCGSPNGEAPACGAYFSAIDGSTGRQVYGASPVDCTQPVRLEITSRGHVVASFASIGKPGFGCIVLGNGEGSEADLDIGQGVDPHSLAVSDSQAYWTSSGAIMTSPV
jgi:hypothetical protein